MTSLSDPSVLYLESSALKFFVRNGKSSLRLQWRGEGVSTERFIFAPWNINNNHWVLLAADIVNRKVMHTDPLHNSQDLQIQDALEPYATTSWILNAKLSTDEQYTLTFPKHTLQNDSSSCGDMTCWYAHELQHCRNLSGAVSTDKFRHHIYQIITGTCLDNVITGNLAVYLDCGNDGQVEWVECDRYSQWYHCDCVDITLEEVNDLTLFLCPEQ